MSTWRPFRSDPDDDLPRPLRSSLDGVARAMGGTDADRLRVVFGQWAAAVGELLAAHAEPVSLRDGLLVVSVTEPAWATQLRFLEPEILGRLADTAGAPVAERIEVRVRPRRASRKGLSRP